jgi:hypothetical protein
LKLLPNANQPILIRKGQRINQKQLIIILNHLTTNQNELIINQNRIAAHLSKLAEIFKGFSNKNETSDKELANKSESEVTKKRSGKNVTELSFTEEMKNMNEELQELFKMMPK